MDTGDCLQAIVGRCVLLVIYYDHPGRSHMAKTGMKYEMTWLSADARRWGVSGESVGAGVLDELRRKCGGATADRLHGEFMRDFSDLLKPNPPLDPI